MFVDLQNDLHHQDVLELLSLSVFPDPDELAQAVASYETQPNRRLCGLISEQEELIGIIGYELDADSVVHIRHIAVRADRRGEGFARGMILELIAREEPNKILAETDEEAVDFYRNIGFTIESMGERYPGIERFKCQFVPIYEQQ